MLVVENLRKVYGNFKALDGISFTLERGSILGLVGENGAGKSTTIRILVGLLKPTSGRVEYDGLDLFENLKVIKRRIGYVPEVDSLYEDMKALDYLKFFAAIYGVNKGRCEELMEMLGIPNKTIAELSKGMKRKLTIARSLVHDPDYLIYDEPMGGLDPSTSLMIAEFMKGLREKAILFSAHNLYYVEYVCDEVIIMKGGKILYYGDIENLKGLQRYVVKYRLNGKVEEFVSDDGKELNEFLRSVLEDGGEVLSVNVSTRRLEDVYFELIGESPS